jgi:hypothetical protein
VDETNIQTRELSMADDIDAQVRLLAAIAYGEAGIEDVSSEIGAIAWAVANRARMWGACTVTQLIKKDPNYTYAVTDGNARYAKLKSATKAVIDKSPGMTAAVNSATAAIAGTGTDLAAGGIWWDGLDFKTNSNHPKRLQGFKYGAAAHNIFAVPEFTRSVIIFWRVINKRTGKEVDGKERGRYDHVYISTAAYGNTIVWKYNPDYLSATGGKAYK